MKIVGSYSVSELKNIIRESSQEFKPVLGAGVESNNKKNNEKAYKDAKERATKYDGGLKEPKSGSLPDKTDFNATMLDYNPRVEPDKEWKEKVEAQAEGFTSKAEKNNGIEKADQYDKEGKLYKQFKKANEVRNGERNELASSGLQSSKMKQNKKPSMYESILKPKRLTFKRTTFLNESQMLSRIPEEYKKEGQIIYLNDAGGNEYIVECEKNSLGNIEANIKSHSNKTLMNEQISRIEELMNYKPNTNTSLSNKNDNFTEMMNLARGVK